jgi:hypothetical protein
VHCEVSDSHRRTEVEPSPLGNNSLRLGQAARLPSMTVVHPRAVAVIPAVPET